MRNENEYLQSGASGTLDSGDAGRMAAAKRSGLCADNW